MQLHKYMLCCRYHLSICNSQSHSKLQIDRDNHAKIKAVKNCDLVPLIQSEGPDPSFQIILYPKRSVRKVSTRPLLEGVPSPDDSGAFRVTILTTGKGFAPLNRYVIDNDSDLENAPSMRFGP